MFSTYLLGFLILFFLFWSVFFLFPWLFGAPFEPTKQEKLPKILRLARIKKGDKAVDLGSGDGRIVIEMAKKGAEAHGFEINPFLVWLSRRKIRKLGLSKHAFIHWGSFWKADFSAYDVIVLFQFSTIMARLKTKLLSEIKPSTRVVSYYWKFPNWKIKKRIGDVFLYKKKQ